MMLGIKLRKRGYIKSFWALIIFSIFLLIGGVVMSF